MLSGEAPHGRRSPQPAARTLKLIAALALAAGLIAGCGEEDGGPVGADHAFAAGLTVTLDADGPGGEPPRTKQIACDTVEDCYGLEPADFDPVPPDAACTEIYGGPDRVELEGHFGGREVPATDFTRENGCEIERFDRLTELLLDVFPEYRPGAALAP